LPSTLDDEKELMRETFYRFTNDVVAPLAEEIHRQDQDIPEAIIRPAAELGCFGTCIPERFGGLQPDNSSDSLGMIVVTEELSRGSLGAAGSHFFCCVSVPPANKARAAISGRVIKLPAAPNEPRDSSSVTTIMPRLSELLSG
jgi:alkylation response protein AidB-like acyl-CoA dehydrogenase